MERTRRRLKRSGPGSDYGSPNLPPHSPRRRRWFSEPDYEKEPTPLSDEPYKRNLVFPGDTDINFTDPQQLLHWNKALYNPDTGDFVTNEGTDHLPERPAFYMKRVEMPDYPGALFEVRAGPPYEVEVDAVPMEIQVVLREYNTVSRKTSLLIKFYRIETCPMLDDFNKWEWRLERLLRCDPVYDEIGQRTKELLKELKEIIKSLEDISSKAYKNYKECFGIAEWINEFYLEDISDRKRARKMQEVVRKLDRFKSCLSKVKYCTQIGLSKKRHFKTLKSSLLPILGIYD